ncbi:MAG: uridine diphosphate-N-acetylglucosamine-binding protein YvcK [Planctomycetes bacterium]|nr:uridine diphosphate-N-acetylglucosamine-binding protein YvcK [Planctomycetota bacterium]
MALFPRLFRRSPAVVAIGGGTGASGLLRGLKEHTDKLTAVVTVADDGGSSGRFRKEFGMLPPGDIRNCLAALSDAGPVLEKLFQHRFEEGDLKGHPFGNIFLAAMTQVTGDFEQAVREANRVLNVRGRVLPATATKISLIAEHDDGSKTTGESLVGKVTKPVKRLSLKPEDSPAGTDVVDAILQADLVLLGPGSVYTSVLPNLLIHEIEDALMKTPAVVGYICNIMTQPGETQDFSASRHVEVLIEHTNENLIDFVVVNTGKVPDALAAAYAAEHSTPVAADLDKLTTLKGSPRIITGDLVKADHVVRHNPARLAELCLNVYKDINKERARA